MSSYNTALEEIKSRIDIVDVISENVSLKKAGQNWRGLCPFHTEKTPSFMVSPSKQIYHCFGCGSGGDVFTFLIKQGDLSFQDALSTLAERAGVQLRKSLKTSFKSKEKKDMLGLYRDACLFYQRCLQGNAKAADYLEEKGITREAQKLFSLGYAPNKWDALFSYLVKIKGHKAETIIKAGLIARGPKNYYDNFRDRIIFPIFNLTGEAIAFGGRVMNDSMPKYLNSPESPFFSKGKMLYGLNLAKDPIKKSGFAIFVEGYLDLITVCLHGFSNVVAPLGTALTQEHGKLIKRFTQNVVLVFDGDASGIRAAKKAMGILLESGLSVKALPMPEGEDPDSFLRKRGKEAFDNLLEKAMSIVDFFVMQAGADSIRGVDAARFQGNDHLVAHEALEIISKIPDSILQGYYVKSLSERLNINELFIREELRKIKKRTQRPKSISAKKDVDISGSRSRQKPMDEVYLLKLILQFPETAEKVLNTVSVEDFEDSVIRAVFEKIKIRNDSHEFVPNSSRDGLIDFNALISECDEEEKNFLTELSFKDDLENPEKIFKDCLNRLKFKKRQVLLYELQYKITKAELEKNGSLLRTLLLEKQKVLGLKG
ncbi:MAG: DNA primase [Candidatus Mariimomonas ferrooxydans]